MKICLVKMAFDIFANEKKMYLTHVHTSSINNTTLTQHTHPYFELPLTSANSHISIKQLHQWKVPQKSFSLIYKSVNDKNGMKSNFTLFGYTALFVLYVLFCIVWYHTIYIILCRTILGYDTIRFLQGKWHGMLMLGRVLMTRPIKLVEFFW